MTADDAKPAFTRIPFYPVTACLSGHVQMRKSWASRSLRERVFIHRTRSRWSGEQRSLIFCIFRPEWSLGTGDSRYNVGVATPASPKPSPEEKHHHHRHAAYAAEATGLLLMAVLLLILTIIRYWSNINWSIR